LDKVVVRPLREEDGIERKELMPGLRDRVEDLLPVAKDWFEQGY